MIKKGLKPIINKKTRILILGSLPGVDSLEKQQYYAKNTNDFQKLLGQVLNEDFKSLNYEDKLLLLNKYNLGIWDVIKHSIRKGSLDSNIKDEVLNDFSTIKQITPNLKLICFNGKKAGEYESHFKDYKTITLPSSSGANRIKDRVPDWSIIKNIKF